MSLPFKNIAVLCGPQKSESPSYEHAAEELGFGIGRRTVSVSAAGQSDLLSKFSRAANCQGEGIISYFAEEYHERRVLCAPYPRKLIQDEAERRSLVLGKAELLIALPGDLDTCCSFGDSGRPVILVNLNGEFKHANAIMDKAVAEGKIGHNAKGNVKWARCVDEAMEIFDDLRLNTL